MAKLSVGIHDKEAAREHHGHGWQPYMDNGGTVIAIAGKDYCVIGGDTRMSGHGYNIMSRNVNKLTQLNSRVVLGTGGMQADREELFRQLIASQVEYQQQHKQDVSAPSFAQLLSTTLYRKRFFPYYCFCLLGGLNAEGRGVVYGYDAIGSYEEMQYGAQGSGKSLATSVLDNQVAFKTQPQNKRDLSVDEALSLLKTTFTVVGERDIHTGDDVQIYILTADGVRTETFELKKD